MQTPCLGIATGKNLIIALEEKQANVKPAIVGQGFDFGLQARDIEITRPHVYSYCERRDDIFTRQQHGREQRKREVIDRFIAHIF